MTKTALSRNISNKWLLASVTALLYFLSGCLIFVSPWLQNYISAVWPPAGIGLGAVLLWGNPVLPGIYIADFILHYEFSERAGTVEKQTIHLLLPLVSVLQAWLGSLLARRFADYPNEFVSLRSILLFFFVGGPVAASFSSALRIFALHHYGELADENLSFSFFSLILAQTIGIIVFTPLFFVVFNKSHRIWKQRLISLGAPVIVIFFLITAAYFFSENKEQERLNKIISNQAQGLKTGLQEEFQLHARILNRLNVLLRQGEISESLFRLNVKTDFLQHPDILKIEWLRGYKSNAGQSFSKVYSESQNQEVEFGNIPDLLSRLNMGAQPKTFLGRHQYLVAFPNFERGPNSCNCIKEVLVGIFDIEQSLQHVMLRGGYRHIAVMLAKDINKPELRTVFGFDESAANSYPLPLAKLEIIELGSNQAMLQIMPSKKFLAEYYSRSPWQLLVSGMFLTAFMSIGLLVLTGHTEFVATQVDKRTQELKRSNLKLAASERQFRKLVETQSAVVWRADPVTFKFLFVSSEAVSILGYSTKQWLTEPDFWQNHLHEDDRAKVLKNFTREVSSTKNRSFDLEYRMTAADGHIVWLRDIATLVVESGVITELYGFMIDITTQKYAEEQLRLAANTFESLQGVLITDKNASILRVNKAFTQITGYPAQQVIGKNPKILSSGRHDKTFYDNYWHRLLTYDKVEGEIWNRRKNGEIYPEWQTVTAVRNDSGEISHFVSVFSDITEKKDAEDKIHNMAFYDPLTNLPNRRLLLDRFDQEIAIARRHNQFGAVLYLDLDHFKLLNDSQGHLVGDELLMQVATRLSSVLREEDTPARLGGDEFVVLLHANSESLTSAADHAMIVAEKIREQLNSPFILGHYQHQIGTSIGVALFPEGDETPDILLQQADTAMYRSKSSGRNTISFFQPSMQAAADLRLNLEQDLRIAIDQGRFILCYHPQTDADGNLMGAEALIRWEDHLKGRLSPADFIPVAEESNLILTIGKWVLLEACSQIKAWQEQGFGQLPFLSINVSSKQFRQHDFVDQVKKALDSTGVAPHLLSIELTESAMIVDTQDTIDKMMALKALGVSIAVDDFGTGYSSLVHLKQLPLDVLKIDKTFVRDILTDSNDAIIVETILSMAQHLKIRVVAEGVETEEQLLFLKQKGCAIFQGYYFSQPLTAASFTERYLSRASTAKVLPL